MTEKRKAVLDIINNSCVHPTAEQIFEELKKQYPTVVLATVYNSLNALSADGLIRCIQGDGSTAVHYDNTHKRHGHLLCIRCGSITDYNADQVFEKIAELINFPAISFELNIRYVCDNCKNHYKEK